KPGLQMIAKWAFRRLAASAGPDEGPGHRRPRPRTPAETRREIVKLAVKFPALSSPPGTPDLQGTKLCYSATALFGSAVGNPLVRLSPSCTPGRVAAVHCIEPRTLSGRQWGSGGYGRNPRSSSAATPRRGRSGASCRRPNGDGQRGAFHKTFSSVQRLGP